MSDPKPFDSLGAAMVGVPPIEAKGRMLPKSCDNLQICSPDHPMPKGAPGRWAHTNAHEIGECSEGCCADYRCDDCGHKWREELPQ